MRTALTRTGLVAVCLAVLLLGGARTSALAGDGTAPLMIAQGGPIVREVIVHDDVGDRAFRLHTGCQAGDRGACVRFGILIGQHQERRAEWQRAHPDMFWWDH